MRWKKVGSSGGGGRGLWGGRGWSEDKEAEAAVGRWAAEGDRDDSVDTKKRKTDEDD